MDEEILSLEDGSDERLLLEYLQGKKAQQRWSYAAEVMEMDMAQPMAMGMERQADFGIAGAAAAPQMARARAAPMQKAMRAPAAAPASPPNRMKPEDDVIVADGEQSEDDFQHVKPGSRYYSHLLRKGYNKFSPRIDFT